MALDPTLGNLMTLRLDPTWPHVGLWKHPFGPNLGFVYVAWDDGVQEATSVNYTDAEIIGRAEAYRTFIATANKEIQITIRFRAQGVTASVAQTLQAEVVQPARFLDALKFPVYDPVLDVSHSAPPCLLRIGDLFFGRVVLTQGDIQWLEPFDPPTLLPHGADIACTFAVVRRFQADLSYRFTEPWQ